MAASILWFRHGLRLHDNPALLDAVSRTDSPFYPIFIFDGETAGTSLIGYNRMQFLLESLQDLDNQLKSHGSRLYVFEGSPVNIFLRIWQEIGISKLCFEQDCEPIWKKRDAAVKEFCKQHGIQCAEHVSHTLWDPYAVVEANGGTAPLTYQMFIHTVSTIGEPSRPVSDVDWAKVNIGKLPAVLANELKLIVKIPKPEYFGIHPEQTALEKMNRWIGGETNALKNLTRRLEVEAKAFKEGFYLPNQFNPDLLGPPTSQSAALRYGCLSVRRFYWSIHDLFKSVHGENLPTTPFITGQLIWREYFYTMSVNNPYYAEMERNPICLNISWSKSEDQLEKWKKGQTGYPFIDAAMRQLLVEGWIHHVTRNAVACFLTRGDLWISWEEGLQYFLKYLLDADWSVCAGNWMWVSSSAFEQLLDCSQCICPVNFGRRLDPDGEYIRRYIPELRNFPVEYLYEPWCAPIEIQEKANCIIGKDYPARIVDHSTNSHVNRRRMQNIRESLRRPPAHCCPSSEEEIRQFMWLSDPCLTHTVKN